MAVHLNAKGSNVNWSAQLASKDTSRAKQAGEKHFHLERSEAPPWTWQCNPTKCCNRIEGVEFAIPENWIHFSTTSSTGEASGHPSLIQMTWNMAR